MKRVLTIAGSDPSGGAGIQRDLATFAELGVHGMSAITSMTIQDSLGLHSRTDIDPDLVSAQIDVALSAGVDAIKIGMLANARIVSAVAEALVKSGDVPIVVDPVMFASAGGRLLDEDGVDALRELILPLATVITPNLAEAAVLAGFVVDDEATQERACTQLRSIGSRVVVVTGGHLGGDPVDVLCDADGVYRVEGGRITGPSVRGTGCRYSAAMSVFLAEGASMRDAATRAQGFVAKAISEETRVTGG